MAEMSSTDHLISVLNRLKTMELAMTEFLLESAIKIQTFSEAKFFVLAEGCGTDSKRRYCGAPKLVKKFESGELFRQPSDCRVVINTASSTLRDENVDESCYDKFKTGKRPGGIESSELMDKRRRVDSPFTGSASKQATPEVESVESGSSNSIVKEEFDEYLIDDEYGERHLEKDNDFDCEEDDVDDVANNDNELAFGTLAAKASATVAKESVIKRKLPKRITHNAGTSEARVEIDKRLREVLRSEHDVVGKRVGRREALNPIPLFDDPVPPREDFKFDSVIFMPSTGRRPLLVFRGHIYRIKSFPKSSESRTTWFCINHDKVGCPARIYTSKRWPCTPTDVEHHDSSFDHFCSTTMQDVFVRRAKAEIVYKARNTSENPRQIMKDTLGKEPDDVLRNTSYDSLSKVIGLNRKKCFA